MHLWGSTKKRRESETAAGSSGNCINDQPLLKAYQKPFPTVRAPWSLAPELRLGGEHDLGMWKWGQAGFRI